MPIFTFQLGCSKSVAIRALPLLNQVPNPVPIQKMHAAYKYPIISISLFRKHFSYAEFPLCPFQYEAPVAALNGTNDQ